MRVPVLCARRPLRISVEISRYIWYLLTYLYYIIRPSLPSATLSFLSLLWFHIIILLSASTCMNYDDGSSGSNHRHWRWMTSKDDRQPQDPWCSPSLPSRTCPSLPSRTCAERSNNKPTAAPIPSRRRRWAWPTRRPFGRNGKYRRHIEGARFVL